MIRDFPEADWRILRKLHPVALERFARRILGEVTAVIGDARRSHHERYLDVYRLISDRNDELAGAFDDMRRSRALERILYIRRLGLFEEDEFRRFSDETRQSVERILQASER